MMLLRSLNLAEQDWLAQAACAGSDTDLFFPEGRQEATYFLQKARLLYCNHCPVRVECYAYGTRTKAVGIWGGALIVSNHGAAPPLRIAEKRPVPRRMREPDEEPGWMRNLMRRFHK